MSGASLTHWPAPFMPSTAPSLNNRQLFTPSGGEPASAVHAPTASDLFEIKRPHKAMDKKQNRLQRRMLILTLKLMLEMFSITGKSSDARRSRLPG